MDNLAVSMQGITKIFNGVKANDNVDFNLRKGSIHGLLGENGAGQTTLMTIMYGLYQPEAGDMYINVIIRSNCHHCRSFQNITMTAFKFFV